jgi:hypothetical protein
LDKLKRLINILLREKSHLLVSKTNNEAETNTSFLHEACLQICLVKPYLLHKPTDLISYSKKIVENCNAINESIKFKAKK